MDWQNQDSQQTFGPVLVPGGTIPKNSWTAKYPDQVEDPHSRGITACLAPAVFFVALLVTLPPSGGWTAVYPDVVRTAEPHASQQRAVFLTLRTEAAPAAGSPHGPLIPFQGASPGTPTVFAPVEPPAPPAVVTFFQSQYPDPSANHPAYQGAVSFLFTPAPTEVTTGWDVYTPAIVPTRPPLTLSGSTAPILPPDVSQFGWRGSYPVALDRLPTPAGWVTTDPTTPTVTIHAIDWYVQPQMPIWPEWRDRTHTVGSLADFGAITRFGWPPAYPDRIDRQIPSYEGAVARPILPPDVTRLAWHPDYPARIFTVRPVDVGWIAQAPPPPDTSRLGWQPTYPATIDRLRPDGSGWCTRPLREPDDLARFAWHPTYPDWLERRVPTPTWITGDRALVPTPFGWVPVYDAQVPWRGGLVAAYDPAFFFDPFPFALPIPAYGWHAFYPDWIDRRILTAQIPSYFPAGTYQPALPVPLLSWAPIYPTDPTRRIMPIQTQGILDFTEVIPPPPVGGEHDDKFTLGTKESLGVQGFPTIGGWWGH